jgi:hypothetical protein
MRADAHGSFYETRIHADLAGMTRCWSMLNLRADGMADSRGLRSVLANDQPALGASPIAFIP